MNVMQLDARIAVTLYSGPLSQRKVVGTYCALAQCGVHGNAADD